MDYFRFIGTSPTPGEWRPMRAAPKPKIVHLSIKWGIYSVGLPYDGLVAGELFPSLIGGLDVSSVKCTTCRVIFNCKECQYAGRTI